MSIKKLLGTGACMVIIGVSAGASYGLFERLSQQLAGPAFAQTSSPVVQTPSDTARQSQFVAAGVTTWTPPEKSNVPTPVLILPEAVEQPEPPLLRFASINTDDATRAAPILPFFAHLDDAIILDARPIARGVVVASAPRGDITPGTLQNFRSQTETETKDDNDDGLLKKIFTPRTALKPAQPRRPTAAASERTVRKIDRFRKYWATGVFR